MDKLLRPHKFDADLNSSRSSQKWIHWKATFENFISSVVDVSEKDKFKLLVNYVSNNIYELISDCTKYSEAKHILEAVFVKPKNEIFARHILMTKRQHTGENIDQYVQRLKVLSKDCNFLAVSADQNKEDYIRDSFSSGFLSNDIRQRLLENNSITLQDAILKAQFLESASKHSRGLYNSSVKSWKCYFCGSTERHPLSLCPARDKVCKKCSKVGPFSKVCRLQMSNSASAAVLATTTSSSNLRNLAAAPQYLSKSVIKIKVNGNTAESLIHTDVSLLDCDNVTGSESEPCNEQFIKDQPSTRLSDTCEENTNISPVNVLEEGSIETDLREENKDIFIRRGTRERIAPAYLKDFVEK
uniref:Uncharacterized protein LOC114335178 n=1 Tax=Diabrotica virgifera virgifera TaxID=50390 RepID=A0A6P7G2B9_DIAVI